MIHPLALTSHDSILIGKNQPESIVGYTYNPASPIAQQQYARAFINGSSNNIAG
jgi:hypothetical protein